MKMETGKRSGREDRGNSGLSLWFQAGFLLLLLVFWLFPQAVRAADMGDILPGETKSGSLTAPSFLDSWTFDGSTGDRVVITAVRTGGDNRPEIVLYPPGGGPAEAYTYDLSGSRLDHQLEQSGLYTIIVQDHNLDHSGTYNITLLKMPGTVSSPEDPDGGPIASGETHGGQMSVSDLDAFQFY
ncbi:MAG: hypothetical protein SWH78_02755, partial [Thermodesulfobacteriota bacterium]|nr:hypothetical protein [Thermodesulfobacteriota bacterium]